MAPPPPVTPTPHRFLVPKRSQPKHETPRTFQTQAGGGRQFQTTPRFSLHSTPRNSDPPSSSTPAAANAAATAPGALYRQRNASQVDDVIDSSGSSPPSSRDPAGDRRYASIEEEEEDDDDDVVVQESSPAKATSSNASSDDEGLGAPVAKRRRISISVSSRLGIGESPQPANLQEIFGDDDDDDDEPFDNIATASPLPNDPSEEDIEMEDAALPLDKETSGQNQNQQPTFQKAPRFKQSEIAEGSLRHEPLPEVFSPHRKGAKYIPGGLAAELRSWLVDVEAGSSGSLLVIGGRNGDPNTHEDWIATVKVDEVGQRGDAAAAGMTLVTGRPVSRNHHEEQLTSAEDTMAGASSPTRILLAGPGRLHGLMKRNEVRAGSVVGIARPTWDVLLDDLGRWAVACDWAVIS